MSQPFLGEVKLISWNFPPKGWAFCNGQQLQINQNQALYSLLGITYGGNGTTNFNLPNLQGNTPIHWTNRGATPAVALGQTGGETAHTLAIAEMSAHNHTPFGSSATPDSTSPGGNLLGARGSTVYTTTISNLTPIIGGTVGTSTGGGQSHPNMQPYQVLNFIIALAGVYPSRP